MRRRNLNRGTKQEQHGAIDEELAGPVDSEGSTIIIIIRIIIIIIRTRAAECNIILDGTIIQKVLAFNDNVHIVLGGRIRDRCLVEAGHCARG